MKTIAFFNSTSGVGQTSLVYHLAWMFADHGVKTLAVDLDPQAALTAMFLDEDRLETLWQGNEHRDTVYGAIRPLLRGSGDTAQTHVEMIDANLGLIASDPALSRFEDKLSKAWTHNDNPEDSALRTIVAFHGMIQQGADWGAELALVDLGSNLGAINRAALIASDLVCLPLAPNLFSLQGLKSLGPTLRQWHSAWADLRPKAPADLPAPHGSMQLAGYVVLQESILDRRTGKSCKRWLNQIPGAYREAVMAEPLQPAPAVAQDPYCLALLKHYHSLMAMAIEARKPMFFLKPADGAIGAHVDAVKTCYVDFKNLALKLAPKTGVTFT